MTGDPPPSVSGGDQPDYIDQVFEGSCEKMDAIPDGVVQTCVTSPPYWGLRDYGVEGQLGLEPSPEEYVEKLVQIFREVRRVLRDDGTLWLNLGDSYAGGKAKALNGAWTDDIGDIGWSNRQSRKPPRGLKPKDLVGIPWRVALALQADGWWLRSDIIWAKRNPIPTGAEDRPRTAHEYIFLMAKAQRYFYDIDAVRTPQKSRRIRHEGKSGYRDNHPTKGSIKERKLNPLGANIKSVWSISTSRYPGAHFSTFPEKLIEPCILAGSAPGDLVLDPFMGSGTTALVALKHRRHFTGYELNPDYHEIIRKRIAPFKNQTRLTENGAGW